LPINHPFYDGTIARRMPNCASIPTRAGVSCDLFDGYAACSTNVKSFAHRTRMRASRSHSPGVKLTRCDGSAPSPDQVSSTTRAGTGGVVSRARQNLNAAAAYTLSPTSSSARSRRAVDEHLRAVALMPGQVTIRVGVTGVVIGVRCGVDAPRPAAVVRLLGSLTSGQGPRGEGHSGGWIPSDMGRASCILRGAIKARAGVKAPVRAASKSRCARR
jgi:hypothetical protein